MRIFTVLTRGSPKVIEVEMRGFLDRKDRVLIESRLLIEKLAAVCILGKQMFSALAHLCQ